MCYFSNIFLSLVSGLYYFGPSKHLENWFSCACFFNEPSTPVAIERDTNCNGVR